MHFPLARLFRWGLSRSRPPRALVDVHALARQGQAQALTQALTRDPALALRPDALALTPLGAALTGWGGPAAGWSARRLAAMAVLAAHAPTKPLPPQSRDGRHPLELLPCCDLPLARQLIAWVPREALAAAQSPSPVPVPADTRAWRHALGLGVRAQTPDELAHWMDWMAGVGADWSAGAGRWLLLSLGNSPLGPGWVGHPADCFRVLEDAGVPVGSHLLALLEPRSGHGLADVQALGRALSAWPFRHPVRSFDEAHLSALTHARTFLARWHQSVDWVDPLAARLRQEAMAYALPTPEMPIRSARQRL